MQTCWALFPVPVSASFQLFVYDPLYQASLDYMHNLRIFCFGFTFTLLGFGLMCNLTHRLALYPVSVRWLLGIATPLPPPLPLLAPACGSLHLAVNTRGGTFTRENCAMPGTHKKQRPAASVFCCCVIPRFLSAPGPGPAGRDMRSSSCRSGCP